MIPEDTVHLTRHQHLIQVMHLLIGKAVIIFTVGMFIQGTGRIEFKSVNPLIHKVGQVVEPVLQT